MQKFGSDHFLKLLSSAYPGLLAYIGPDYRLEFASSKFLDWFEISSKNFEKISLVDLLSPEEFLVRKKYIDRALKGEYVSFSAILTHKKNGPREMELIYHPDIDESGEVRGYIVIASDVTDKKRAERSALENEARFRSLTEVMPQLVWIADGEGKFIYLNENWARVTGTTLKENLGNGWLNVLHPEDRINTLLGWNETIQVKNNLEVEYRLRMKDGSHRWHVSRAIPIKGEEGMVVRWVGTTTDIEEQKNARDLALLEKRKMYALFEQAPAAIIVYMGPEHVIELVNQPAQKYISGRQVIGLPAKEALPEFASQRFIHLLDQVYNSGESRFFSAKSITLKNSAGNSSEIFTDLFYKPIKDANGLTTGIVNMVVDVTEQVKALRFAEEKERKLEEALVARDQFLSIASHELKTPLTSLKLQAQLTLRLLNLNKELPLERQIAMANQTNELVGRLTRLIDDMLDVSRIKTGKLKLDKAEHDLGDIVREVIFGLSVLFEAADLKIPTLEISENIIGIWDRFRLEQVIGNLMTNAIRYGRGSPIQINVSKRNNLALVQVTDQGYGIGQEDLVRIFGRFERAINSSEVSGLGLGLFISKEIVESHGGRIWVESEIGKGSTFFVELPL